MISVEKPGSPAEIVDYAEVLEIGKETLEHHGIKGMKWGQRRAINRASRAAVDKQRAKEGQGRFGGHGLTPSSVKANIRVAKAGKAAAKAKKAEFKSAKPAGAPQKGIALGRASREFRAQHPTAKTQARAIRTARKESAGREKVIRKTKDSVERARLLRDHMNNPGTAIAMRTTRGEKAAIAIVAGLTLGTRVPAYATAIAGGTALDRRFVERKQRKGGFQ